jgi:hypothetical protein
MPINPQHTCGVTIKDYSDEDSRTSIHIPAITALNIAAFLADFGDYKVALAAIILGVTAKDFWTGDITKYDVTPPADVNAQRERKWVVHYQGTTTFSKYRLEIPTADFTGRLLPNTDLADLTDTDIAAFITAFETLARTEEGENCEVLYIEAVGRNL